MNLKKLANWSRINSLAGERGFAAQGAGMSGAAGRDLTSFR